MATLLQLAQENVLAMDQVAAKPLDETLGFLCALIDKNEAAIADQEMRKKEK